MKWIRQFNTWRIGTEFITLDAYEDCDSHDPNECECTEVWVGDDETGNHNTEGIFDSYVEADQYVKQFIKENPNGWMLKDKLKQVKTFILS